MNSFTMKPSASLKREAEGLLRMVLFSKDLRLKRTDMTLDQHRYELARMLRIFRKRGVVPAFISTMWFWFAMAVSIQQAFGLLGQNAEAHDLALGLLLAWVPVLILCSVVDRDFVSGEEVRVRLNNLINLVIDALADDEIRQEYKDGLHDMHDAAQMGVWLDSIVRQTKETNMKDFFLDYAGQGRVRYHYGAAHPILCDIERSYIVARGRAWMTNEREARYSLVLGKIGGNLIWFDFNELWQIAFGVIIVTGTILGAFTLSFFTPTVGLGCRSGGYLIFWVVSFVLLLTELVLWYLTTPTGWNDTLHKTMSRTISRYEELRLWIRRHTRRFFSLIPRGVTLAELAYYRTTRLILRAFCVSQEVLDRREKRRLRNIEYRDAWSLNDWAHFSFFRPIESLNAIWLTYIVAAQTVGSYETCECQTSNWGAGGGYLDFTQFNVSNAPWLIYIWVVSTVIALVAMGIPMIYITTQWCLISVSPRSPHHAARTQLNPTTSTSAQKIMTAPVAASAAHASSAASAIRSASPCAPSCPHSAGSPRPASSCRPISAPRKALYGPTASRPRCSSSRNRTCCAARARCTTSRRRMRFTMRGAGGGLGRGIYLLMGSPSTPRPAPRPVAATAAVVATVRSPALWRRRRRRACWFARARCSAARAPTCVRRPCGAATRPPTKLRPRARARWCSWVRRSCAPSRALAEYTHILDDTIHIQTLTHVTAGIFHLFFLDGRHFHIFLFSSLLGYMEIDVLPTIYRYPSAFSLARRLGRF